MSDSKKIDPKSVATPIQHRLLKQLRPSQYGDAEAFGAWAAALLVFAIVLMGVYRVVTGNWMP